MNLLRRFRTIFAKRRLESEMSEEMQLHLELRTERNIAAGMSLEEARAAAYRGFGGLEQMKERAREQRSGAWLGFFAQDLSYGLRTLRRTPIFTSVAILSLAIGIGAATAVFSLVNGILLGSLPVPNPQELRFISWSGTETHMKEYAGYGGPEIPGRKSGNSFSDDLFSSLRKECQNEADIFGYAPFFDGAAQVNGKAMGVDAYMVSSNFFSALEVRPLLGSYFDRDDNGNSTSPTVVISYRWWEQQFGLSPNAIGQQILLNGRSFTVAAVLPSGFTGVVPGSNPDLYFPLSLTSPVVEAGDGKPVQDIPNAVPKSPDNKGSLHQMKTLEPPPSPKRANIPSVVWKAVSPGYWRVAVAGRIKPGVSDSQLQAILDTVLRTQAQKEITESKAVLTDGRNGPEWSRSEYRLELRLLLTVVAVIVIVACANLAGLLLARGASRQHELAVRGALGAGRARLVRQLLTESALLSLFGGCFGIFIAYWGKTVLSQLLASSEDGLHFDTPLDLKVLGFAFLVTLLTVLLAGLAPALRSGITEPLNGLRDRTTVGLPKLRAGQFIIVAQIALSFLLVAAAGLYVRTLVNLLKIDPGFEIENLLEFTVNPGNAGYQDARAIEYFENIQRSLIAIPGVRSATLHSDPFLSGGAATSFELPDQPLLGQHGELLAGEESVGDDFFKTVGIPMLLGREFHESDSNGTSKVVVVSQTFVRRYFSGEAPIGRTIKVDGVWQIVGVCGDAHTLNLKGRSLPMMYFPFRQHIPGRASFALRTELPPFSVAAAARTAVNAVDSSIPVTGLSTERQLRDRNISSERTFAVFCGTLAVVALLLSCIGFYGLMAYEVTRRTGEIGVRLALGANTRQIVQPLLQRALLLGSTGLVIGLPLIFAMTKATKASFYGVKASDPTNLCEAIVLLLSVLLLAAWIPAHRASTMDPLRALRCE